MSQLRTHRWAQREGDLYRLDVARRRIGVDSTVQAWRAEAQSS